MVVRLWYAENTRYWESKGDVHYSSTVCLAWQCLRHSDAVGCNHLQGPWPPPLSQMGPCEVSPILLPTSSESPTHTNQLV